MPPKPVSSASTWGEKEQCMCSHLIPRPHLPLGKGLHQSFEFPIHLLAAQGLVPIRIPWYLKPWGQQDSHGDRWEAHSVCIVSLHPVGVSWSPPGAGSRKSNYSSAWDRCAWAIRGRKKPVNMEKIKRGQSKDEIKHIGWGDFFLKGRNIKKEKITNYWNVMYIRWKMFNFISNVLGKVIC